MEKGRTSWALRMKVLKNEGNDGEVEKETLPPIAVKASTRGCMDFFAAVALRTGFA